MIKKLDCTKKSGGNISAKILKLSSNVVCEFIKDNINQSFRSGKFPDRLKLAEITPILKKGDPLDIGNYRLISILPTISKLFEKGCWDSINGSLESL